MSGRRIAAERRGHRGERLAAWWLRLHGWRIVGQRLRVSVGEVDLVARRGRTVVFVEVKWRATATSRPGKASAVASSDATSRGPVS